MPSRANNLLPLAHSATLLSMIAANVAAAILWPTLCWLTIPLAALAMCCALSAVHECAHRTYFTNRLTNEAVGRFWALVILMNFSDYKRDHMLHHRHQGTERDTEPQIVLRSRIGLVRAICFNPHIAPSWFVSLREALLLLPSSQKVRRDAQLLLVVQATIVFTLIAEPQIAMLVFLVPFLLSTVLDNLVSLPEHARLGDADTQPTTRSMCTSSTLDFLLYFVGRHIEHHQSPQNCVARRVVSGESCRGEYYTAFYRRIWRKMPVAASDP
ncbi:MAG: fatty acid desaturase [Hyphomicrobiaceae bacterium]